MISVKSHTNSPNISTCLGLRISATRLQQHRPHWDTWPKFSPCHKCWDWKPKVNREDASANFVRITCISPIGMQNNDKLLPFCNRQVSSQVDPEVRQIDARWLFEKRQTKHSEKYGKIVIHCWWLLAPSPPRTKTVAAHLPRRWPDKKDQLDGFLNRKSKAS